jgi:hypothetical protein
MKQPQLDQQLSLHNSLSKTLQTVQTVSDSDVEALHTAEQSYGDSWKKRGGVGAFMMLARKWDRLEKQVNECAYDIFAAILTDPRSEGIIDDIRDLRRYLLLVEAEYETEMRGLDEPEPNEPELFNEDRCEWKTG